MKKRLLEAIGVAAVTLTVSDVPATPSLIAIGVEDPVATCTLLLVKVLNPESVALTM